MQEPFEQRIRRRNPLTSILSDVGKLQPQAVELEEAVLGALMLDKNAILEVLDILEPDSFYKDEHKAIYLAIVDLYKKSQPIDLLTVTNQLRLTGKLEFAGGSFYISELTNRVSSASNIEYHSRIVAQKYLLRRIIEITSEAQRDAYDETTDVFDLIDKLQSQSIGITEKFTSKSAQKINIVSDKVFKDIDERSRSEETILGIPSGIDSLDRITNGFQKGKLYIIAGRPGMGKSSLARNIVVNVGLKLLKPVGVICLEESSEEWVLCVYSHLANIDSTKLKRANQLYPTDFEKLTNASRLLDKSPIYIDDSPYVNMIQLRAKSKQMKQQYGIEMLVFDYLQLAESSKVKGRTREQEVSEMSRTAKLVAKELAIPALFLSQLSRGVEGRTNKRPQLSDLRESGAIEQDADCVIFCFRPGYYEDLAKGLDDVNEAFLIVDKNRGGKCDTARCFFVAETQTFKDYNTNPETDNSSFRKIISKNYYEPQNNQDDGDVPF